MNLESRIRALELSNRRWRCGVAVTLACALCYLYVCHSIPAAADVSPTIIDVLRTRRLEVVDSENRAVVVIRTVDPRVHPEEASDAKNSEPFFSIDGVAGVGAELQMKGEKGASLCLSSIDTPEVTMCDYNTDTFLRMQSSFVMLSDWDENACKQAERDNLSEKKTAELTAVERDTVWRARFGKQKVWINGSDATSKAGKITVYTHGGDPALILGVKEQDSGTVAALDSEGTVSVFPARNHVSPQIPARSTPTAQRYTQSGPQIEAVARAYNNPGIGHWVKKNVERGQFILLEDGSLWEVDRLERLNASLWLPMARVTVLSSSRGSPGYDYLLINTDDGEKAHAKYVGKQ